MFAKPIVKHSYVEINNSLVHLACYGTGESSFNPIAGNESKHSEDPKKNKALIIFVPGNPGVLGVYHDFLCKLMEKLMKTAQIDYVTNPTLIGISHNNFDHPDHVDYQAEENIRIEDSDSNSNPSSYEPHHIELQVTNKIVILHRLLNLYEGCDLYFVGHSIGCYIILRLLQDRIVAFSHKGSVMLHPALENLALTPKGAEVNRMFNFKLDFIMKTGAYIMDNLLPKQAKKELTKWFCSADFIEKSSEIVVESVMQLACRKSLEALLQMAKSELGVVKDINVDTLIEPHIDKLRLIYSDVDHWVNEAFRDQLHDRYKLEKSFKSNKAIHAFVMDHSTAMNYAALVAGKLSEMC